MLTQRYWIAGLKDSDQCAIWDSKLFRYLGDGKGGFAVFDTWVKAEEVVDIMRERVGA